MQIKLVNRPAAELHELVVRFANLGDQGHTDVPRHFRLFADGRPIPHSIYRSKIDDGGMILVDVGYGTSFIRDPEDLVTFEFTI